MRSNRFEFAKHTTPVKGVTLEIAVPGDEHWGIDAIGIEGTPSGRE